MNANSITRIGRFLMFLSLSATLLWSHRAQAATFIVDSTDDAVDANPGDAICATAEGTCTLRAAIQEANSLAGDDTIVLPTDTYILTMLDSGENGLPTVFTTITIDGNDSIIARDEAAPEFRLLTISSTGNLALNNVTLRGGVATHGGAIYNEFGTLTVTNSVIISNSATVYGGGAIMNLGTTSLVDSMISGNSAAGSLGGGGGAIENQATLTVVNSTLSGNSAPHAGAIWNIGTLTMTGSELSDNSSDGTGGALANFAGTASLEGTTISNNSAGSQGGGILNYVGIALTGITLSGNSAGSGGGIFNYSASGTMTIDTSTISNNVATAGPGGGIDNASGTVTIANSTISGNIAPLDGGGGILNGSGNMVTILTSSVTSNTATYGGGLYNQGTLELTESEVSNNIATSTIGGGGANNDPDATMTVVASTFDGNSAIEGGGIRNIGNLTISASTLSNNTATIYGGAIRNIGDGVNYFGDIVLTASTLSGNAVDNTGGGIFNTGTLAIGNSTFSGNTAAGSFGGGAIHTALTTSSITINNSTFSNNQATAGTGGGSLRIESSGTLTIQNTILAFGLPANCYGASVTSTGYNLDSGNNCGLTAVGDQVNTNPLLGPLQDNGGSTWTHALLPSSPAIDSGNPALPGSGGTACEATDQRDISRPQGTACDIGSFEALQVRFSSIGYSVDEASGIAVITVTLSDVSPLTVTVNYSTRNGTAQGGSDYLAARGILTFGPGETSQTFNIAINNDTIAESDETVRLLLANPVNAALGRPGRAGLLIVDND